ncbi:MAG TPA: TonB-dependent receptor [Longimicrobiales bacterium]
MRFTDPSRWVARMATVLAASMLSAISSPAPAAAQQPGAIAGRVTDAAGAPLPGAQVILEGTSLGTLVRPDGSYVIEQVPPGTHTVVAQMLGYRPQSVQVTVAAGGRASLDFRLAEDALELAALVVTGTQAPRTNLDAPVAVTVLSPQELEKAAPRSTTEALRYVPGFTRVESSGGEVNQNISMRGILGVEYVMFMEDGLPVFPTMHTFFMNADNLFRPDENIERIEVVRGGTSALFGSNTPGAIVNFINHQGGPELRGTMRATVGTQELARYDMNLNGPLGENWRFNVGGFYRFDNGVRDPGFPGIRGGQFKASLTRLLDQGQVRASLKIIDDRNQFILPLPFHDPDDPEYVDGFSDYGSMNTAEGLGLSVPTPDGRLSLPLDDGLRTQAYWLTGDARFVLPDGWSLQNSIQVMENQQGWNAIVPSDVRPVQDWLDDVLSAMGFPDGSQAQLFYTNHRDAEGNRLPFDTENGLVAPAGLWHVEKPLSAFQNQFQLRREIGQHSMALGLYFAHYTQTNHWYFTDILMDVRDQPRFLDLVVDPPGAAPPVEVTRGGFRRFVSNYTNGEGHTTILSGMLGGSFQLSERLRADAGLRYERDEFVLSAENTTTTDLDGDAGTPYDNVVWGAGTFRHVRRTLDDVAASLALNYRLSDEVSLYGLATRAYKMPALDEFLNTDGQEDADSFDVSTVRSIEAGVKYASGRYSLTVNGFLTELRNVLSQGVETDPVTGAPDWKIRRSPETRSFGAEFEFTAQPSQALTLVANATVLKAEFADCPEGCPGGADLGTVLNGVPPLIGNLSATYTLPTGASLLADFHYVHRRFSDFEVNGVRPELPTYHYVNLGATYPTGVPGLTLSATLQNVYQSKGLEEGNPRLTSVGGRTSDFFLARPILPRRLVVSLSYDF